VTTKRTAKVARDRRISSGVTLRSDFLEQLQALEDKLGTVSWPSPRWRDDPAGFAREVLGLRLMSHQVEILEAIRDHRRVAVRSGNKAGKTLTIVVAALWFFCSFPDARVVATATTAPQVDAVIWRTVKAVMRGALLEIPGKLGELARTGLKAPDLREITGHTAREIEAIAGVSGANLFYIVDEASSLQQKFLEAIEGNTAGGLGARIVMISNPTRVDGPFFDAFYKKKEAWHGIHVNCEDVARENRGRIPGIADADQIARWANEYGVDSVFYRVRVKGEFCLNEAGKALQYADIMAAQLRYEEAEASGVFSLGLDPAGPGPGGDECGWAGVKGDLKVVELQAQAGLNEDAIIHRTLEILRTHRGDATPSLVIDAEGPIGGSLFGRFRAIAAGARPGHEFKVYGVRASNHAEREPDIFDRVRDELFANLAKWVRERGAIPADPLLEQELNAPNWAGNVAGKLKLTPKDQLREILGRSPDRSDALALAVWKPISWNPSDPGPPGPEPTDLQDAAEAFDMVGGNDGWWPSGDGGGGGFG
jgi:hypothetical protein